MQSLNNVIQWLQNTFHENTWVIEVFIVVLFTVLVHSLAVFLFNRALLRMEGKHKIWDHAFFSALQKPIGILIWLMGLSFAAQITGALAQRQEIISFIQTTRSLGTLILIAWFLIRFIRRVETNTIEHANAHNKTVDVTLVHAVCQLLTVSVMITAVLIGMQIFNLSISALLAFGGIGGAGIAFASKDMLANFFGGLMIYLDRPFNVGDWIRSPDKSIEGTVEHIGWRLTCIRTFAKRPLYVPNGTFLTISVENPSRMTNRRINTVVGVRYDDAKKVRNITKNVENMLREHPEIDQRQTTFVNLTEFGPSSLNFEVYTFTKTTNWVKFQGIQEDVFLKIIDIITATGAECAFPTQTLHIPEGVRINTGNPNA